MCTHIDPIEQMRLRIEAYQRGDLHLSALVTQLFSFYEYTVTQPENWRKAVEYSLGSLEQVNAVVLDRDDGLIGSDEEHIIGQAIAELVNLLDHR